MKLARSAIAAYPNFDVAAAEHGERIRDWNAHMARVKADADNPNVKPIDRHQPYDRPRAHHLVEAAIDENGHVKYEVHDDGDKMLRAEKDRLIYRVQELEGEAARAIAPPGKWRLYVLRENEINDADNVRAQKILADQTKPGLIDRLVGSKEAPDVKKMIADGRPDEDTQHLADQAERRRRLASIEKIGAQAMHDIEDLTHDTIVAWKEPDFSGV